MPQAVTSQSWNSENSDYKTHPVGSRSPNEQGFFDLLGNVAEWQYVESGAKALIAGGSIDDSPKQLAARSGGVSSLKSDRSRNVGFRVIIGN